MNWNARQVRESYLSTLLQVLCLKSTPKINALIFRVMFFFHFLPYFIFVFLLFSLFSYFNSSFTTRHLKFVIIRNYDLQKSKYLMFNQSFDPFNYSAMLAFVFSPKLGFSEKAIFISNVKIQLSFEVLKYAMLNQTTRQH